MKTYTIHGTRDDYFKVGAVPCMDSEGNIFPSLAGCSRYHNCSNSTMWNAENIRPVKSKTLDKKICTACIYPNHPDILFDPDQRELCKLLEKYETVFKDYIFQGIPALAQEDGTIVKGMKTVNNQWVFSDFDHWRRVEAWVKRGSPMSEVFTL